MQIITPIGLPADTHYGGSSFCTVDPEKEKQQCADCKQYNQQDSIPSAHHGVLFFLHCNHPPIISSIKTIACCHFQVWMIMTIFS